MKRHEAEEAARERASQREKAARKAAEKAGRLDEYVRDKRKAKEASIRAEAARILQKDEKKRAEHKREVAQAAQAKAEQMRKKSGLEDAKRTAKQREQSGLTEKEWKAKEAQQAIWDANGAALYATNQATKPKEDDPYAGMEEFYENQDRINAEMLEEVPELQRWANLQSNPPEASWQRADSVAAAAAAAQKNVRGPKAMAMPAPDGRPEECKWWQLWCRLKNWVGGDNKKQPIPTSTPDAIATQVSSIWTQTAQAMPTNTPTPTLIPTATPFPPTPVFTSTQIQASRAVISPIHNSMLVTYPTNFRSTPDASDSSNFIEQLPLATRINLLGEQRSNDGYTYQKIMVNNQTGWVIQNYLEQEYVSTSVKIDSSVAVEIPSILNAGKPQAQFLNFGLDIDPDTGVASVKTGPEKNNLCGQFCVANGVGVPIDDMITTWVNQEAGAGYNWQEVSRTITTADDTTGVEALENMLNQYNCSGDPFLKPFLVPDPSVGRIVTPVKIKQQIDNGYNLILGVQINNDGVIGGGNIGHWIKVDDIAPQGVNNGEVLVYNSMKNGQEIVDYETLMRTAGVFSEGQSMLPNMPEPQQINGTGLWVDFSTCEIP